MKTLRVVRLILVSFFVSTICWGDDVSQRHGQAALELAEITVSQWRQDHSLVELNALYLDLRDDDRDDVAKAESDFKESANWPAIKKLAAQEYARLYTETELEELLQFCSTKTAAKFIANESVVRTSVSRQLIEARLRDVLVRRTKENVKHTIEALNGAAREKVTAAMRAESIPARTLYGMWYAKEEGEEGGDYYGTHEILPSGFSRTIGITLDRELKEYSKFDEKSVWVLQGRLLAETDTRYPDTTNLMLIDSVTDQVIKYRFVEPETPIEEWLSVEDTRTNFELPEKPDGYSDVSE